MTRIKFEDLPSTNTPINAENLNKLNNVIVSSEEPTTGEEVWLERSGNIFDGQIELGGLSLSDGSEVVNPNRVRSVNYLKVSPNTTYIIQRTETTGYRWCIGYNSKKEVIEDGYLLNNEEVVTSAVAKINVGNISGVFTTTPTTEYIRWYDTESTNTEEIVMIEKKNKKIYTKNDNGVYEEFYNEKPEVKKGRLNITVMPTSEISSSYQNQVTIIEGNITTTGGDLLIMLNVGRFKTSSGNSYITAFVNENNVGRIIGSSKGEYSSESGTDVVTNISAGTHKISMKLAPNAGYTAYVGSFNQITLTVIEL